jgi:glycosyltransferase involved in cell wall biosynthesis
MPARRLLIITYYYPPHAVIGSIRWAAISEWLRRGGHEVTVITSRLVAPTNAQEPGVLRTFDVGAVGSMRKLLRRWPAPQAGSVESVSQPTPRWIADVIVPDAYLLTWCPAALMTIRRVVRERAIDCVITTGPPHSTHLLPLCIGRDRPAWIVDLREGWRFEPLRPPWPTRVQTRLDGALERVVARTAEQVIGISRPMAADAHSRLDACAAHVSNGWDPAAAGAPTQADTDAARALLDPDRVNMVHTGSLMGWGRGRDPRPIFEALRRLVASRAGAAERVRVVLAGRLSIEEKRMLAELSLGVPVEHVGALSRSAALALQREADVLLLFTSPTDVSDTTGKLFDYLSAGRPILALGCKNEAARIIAETRTGIMVHPDDADGIDDALEAAIDGGLEREFAPQGLSRYTYPELAKDVAELVEVAIAQRARSLSPAPNGSLEAPEPGRPAGPY